MTLRKLTLLLLILSAAAATSCFGGGGGGSKPVSVTAINLNPASPAAGTVVALSATLSGGDGSTAVSRTWTVSSGTLSASAPDFSLVLRQTAKGVSASSLTTTKNSVYWLTPSTAGSATITVTVEGSEKTRTVSLGDSPVTLSVADGEDGAKIVTVAASDVTDLYQAAFRVNFTSAWDAVSATQGDFLGAPADTLFLGLTNQSGFVPVAITRKGNAGGVDGSGTLATITFEPVSGTSALRAISEVPFELGSIMLRNSADEEIEVDL